MKESILMEVKCSDDKILQRNVKRSKKKVNKYEYIYTSQRKK